SRLSSALACACVSSATGILLASAALILCVTLIRSSPRKRGPRAAVCGPWVPAYAGMNGVRGGACCSLSRCLDQTLGGGTGLCRDLGPGEHARDFLAALVSNELEDVRGNSFAFVERALGDEIVAVRASGHLRRMRHGEHR